MSEKCENNYTENPEEAKENNSMIAYGEFDLS